MDPISVATIAASVVSGYLARIASGVVDRATNEASDRLYRLVSTRLQDSHLGASVLERLQHQPGEVANQDDLAMALADEIRRDERFGADLANLLNPTPHVVAQTTAGATRIVNTGRWNDRQGVIATEGSMVDQSRRFRLGTGGIAAAVAAAILLVGGGTAVVINTAKSPYPELDGSWKYTTDATISAPSVIRVDGDEFVLDVAFPQLHCEGKVSRNDDQHYRFTAEQGSCPHLILQP